MNTQALFQSWLWFMPTDLVLGKFRLLSSSHQGYVVGSTKHFCYTNTSIEVLSSDQLQVLNSREGRTDLPYLVIP